MSDIFFISGIDTDAGKSYVTGWLARNIMEQGRSVITQKFIQTGNSGRSEDIELHRAITGSGMLPEDLAGTTAPVIYSYPASPQLAAEIDHRPIDLDAIDKATETLARNYDTVLIEGAGGLAVPLTDDFLTIDYITSRNLPLILVTNGILGSINHTVLSLEAIKSRGIKLHSVVYNTWFDSSDNIIAADTKGFIQRYIARHFPDSRFMVCPDISFKKY